MEILPASMLGPFPPPILYQDILSQSSQVAHDVLARGKCHILSLNAISGVSLVLLKTMMKKQLMESKMKYRKTEMEFQTLEAFT